MCRVVEAPFPILLVSQTRLSSIIASLQPGTYSTCSHQCERWNSLLRCNTSTCTPGQWSQKVSPTSNNLLPHWQDWRPESMIASLQPGISMGTALTNVIIIKADVVTKGHTNHQELVSMTRRSSKNASLRPGIYDLQSQFEWNSQLRAVIFHQSQWGCKRNLKVERG